MEEFVGLRAKMNSYIVDNSNKNHIIAIGIKKNILKNDISHDDYKKVLFSIKPIYCEQNIIKSRKHGVSTETVYKKAICALDDKRYICKNNIETLPWGDYKIPK